MSEVTINLDSKRRPVTRAARIAGKYPYYGANGVQDYVDDFIFDGSFVLVGEDGSVVSRDNAPVVNWADGRIWVNNHAHVLAATGDLNLRYLYFYLQSVDVREYVTGGAQPKLNQANLNRIPVPLPEPDEQKRIVAILDELEALVNDLSVGLPAEIEARRQQYEHYRDKLLAFEEAA